MDLLAAEAEAEAEEVGNPMIFFKREGSLGFTSEPFSCFIGLAG